MNKTKRMLYDAAASLVALVVIVLSVIALLNTGVHSGLLPFAFLAGCFWFALTAGRGFYKRKILYPVICCMAVIVLLFFTIKGFIVYWG